MREGVMGEFITFLKDLEEYLKAQNVSGVDRIVVEKRIELTQAAIDELEERLEVSAKKD